MPQLPMCEDRRREREETRRGEGKVDMSARRVGGKGNGEYARVVIAGLVLIPAVI